MRLKLKEIFSILRETLAFMKKRLKERKESGELGKISETGINERDIPAVSNDSTHQSEMFPSKEEVESVDIRKNELLQKLKSYGLSPEDIKKTERILTGKFSSTNEFEKIITQSKISGNFISLKKENRDEIIRLLCQLPKGEAYAEYEVVYSYIDGEHEEEYVDTEDESKNGECKQWSLGLKKNDTWIHKPKYTIYKAKLYDLYMFLKFLDRNANEPNEKKHIALVKSYIESLISTGNIINSSKLKEKTTQQKKEWFFENQSLYFLFDANYRRNLQDFSIFSNSDFESHKNNSLKMWDAFLFTLNEWGISQTKVNVGVTVVQKNWLSKGWEVRNTENKTADKLSEDFLVYGIIQHGIEIDGELIRPPIVNVKAYKKV